MVRRSLLLALACVALATADTGFYSTVQVTETDGSPKCQAGQIKFGAGQVSCSGQTATVTITGGSGGGPSGQINSAAQYSVSYYSVSGSSNVLSGATGFRTDNSTMTIDIPVTASSATVRQLIVGNVEGNADGLRFFQGSSNETLEYYPSGASTPNQKLIISNSSVGANARGFSFTTASGSRIFRVDPSIAGVFVTGNLTASSATTLSGTVTISSGVLVTGPGGTVNTYGITSGSVTVNDLTVSLPVQTDTANKLISLAIDLSGSQATGVLAAGRFPALTGDVTTSAGALATTATALQNNIVTLGASSITISGASGLYVPNGIIQSTAIYVSSASIYQNAWNNGNTSTAQTIDWTHSNIQISTATGNVTYTFLAPPVPRSARLSLCVLTGAGSFTATWPATVRWSGIVTPVLTTTASKVDCFTFTYIYEINGGTYFGEFGQSF